MIPPVSGSNLPLFPGITSAAPSAPAFTQPLVFSTYNPLVGFRLPVVASNPLLAQPAMTQESGVLINANVESEDLKDLEQFRSALNHVSSRNEKEAGRIFAEILNRRRGIHEKIVGHQDALFVEAVFGSALWGEVTVQTFADLRQIRKKSKDQLDKFTMAREMILRSVAHSRVNDDDTAEGVIRRLLDDHDLATCGGNTNAASDALRVYAMIGYVNLMVNRAQRHTGKERLEAFDKLYHVTKTLISKEVAGMKSSGRLTPALTASLSNLYIFVAEKLLEQHYSLDAKEIVNEARVLFPDSDAVARVFNREPVAEDGPASHEISPLNQLMTREADTSVYSHFKAAATEFLLQANFPNNRMFWSTAVKGALLGATLVAGAEIMSGDPAALSDVMIGSAVGATGAAAAGKTYFGLSAPETKLAFKTGHSDGSFRDAALTQFMKLFGTYVFFGGVLPLAEYLPEFMRAGDSGQLQGGGSALSYVVTQGANRLQELYTDVSTSGIVQGSADFWQNWVDTSYFAEAINNALTFPLPSNDPLHKIFKESTFPEFLTDFSFDTPVSIAGSLGLSLLYGYMGVSGLYVIGSMNPRIKKYLDTKISPRDRWFLMPGVYLGTSAAFMVSGIEPVSALLLILSAYLIQHKNYIHGGGNFNILKKGIWESKDFPLHKYMTAGAVQLLYIGPGNAIRPALPKGLPFLDSFWNAVQAHCGMVAFLALLGVFHAALTGMNPIQTLKAKYAKAWTYEIPANALKLHFGWLSFWGNFLAPLIKEIGFGAPVTNVFREAGNSSIQRSAILGIIAEHRKTLGDAEETATSELTDEYLLDLQQKMIEKAKKIESDGVDAALKGEAYGFLNITLLRKSLPEQLIRLTDAYYLEDDRRLLLSPQLQKKWYRKIVFRALTDPKTPAEKVDEFLDRLRVIASDVNPRLKNVRHNLIVATMRAMAGQAHGERIREFFTKGPGRSIIEAYGLNKREIVKDGKKTKERPSVLDEALAIKRGEDERAWKSWLWNAPLWWIREHYMKPPLTPADELYNAATVAGHRFQFPAPFTGRSLVENVSPITSFLLSATQGDPAFQTRPDLTLYAGTLYGLLMTPAKKERMTTQDYRAKVIIPYLDLTEQIAQNLGDNRKDVRHNLLVTIWLASQGPHGEVVREWMNQRQHLYQANGIYGMLKHDEHVGRLPRRLSQKKLIKQLFTQFLSSSDNSADGKIVYPLSKAERIKSGHSGDEVAHMDPRQKASSLSI